MKTKDWICLLIIIAIFAPFLLSDTLYDHYQEANRQHPYLARIRQVCPPQPPSGR